MSRLIVVIREPLRSMLTPAGLKTLEQEAEKHADKDRTYILDDFCDAIGIDVAECCEDGSCAGCIEDAIAKKADDDDRAYDREMDRRAEL